MALLDSGECLEPKITYDDPYSISKGYPFLF